MKDLSRRLMTSVLSIGALVLIFWMAYAPIFEWAVALLVAALAGVAVWEYEQFVKAKGGRMIMPALIFFTCAEVIAFFIAAKWAAFASLPLIIFTLGFLVLFALHFSENEGAIVDLAVSSFGLLYIAVPMGMLLSILYLPDVSGRWWVIYLLVVTKISDVGAYFAGNLFGKHKLAPRISPSKTVEGALGGLFCSLAASFAFHVYGPFSELEWIVFGLLLGIVGQFGDLSESLLKRDAKKKDSNALPGLGGVLDALDSLLFNIAIVYIYLTL